MWMLLCEYNEPNKNNWPQYNNNNRDNDYDTKRKKICLVSMEARFAKDTKRGEHFCMQIDSDDQSAQNH